MNIDWSMIFNIIVVINAILAIFTVFREKRDIAAIWAWLLVLVFLPLVGFIAYAFLGRKLPKNRLFKLHKHVQMQLDERLKEHVVSWGMITKHQLMKSLVMPEQPLICS